MENKRLPRLYNFVLADERKYTVSFNLNGESSKKLFLEQIDYFTTFYQCEEDMLEYLKQKEIIFFDPLECYIIHKHNGQYKTDKLIYNNKLINRLSAYYIRAKLNNEKVTRIPKIAEVDNYLEYILSSSIKDDHFLSLLKTIVPEHLYAYICQFRSNIESNKEELEDYYENSILRNTIINSFLNFSYRDFRNMVFKLDYYSNLKKEMKSKEVSTVNSISNERVREIYEKCDGDIDRMILEYGEEILEGLNKKDQDLVGYTLYRRRKD
ncbi:MAG: hypothetical protein E7158_05990 [Firmicutes bacterium]|nr:hypothetical protein [Bacillota bacterium]